MSSPSPRIRSGFRFSTGLLFAAALTAAAEVKIERIIMPLDASPSSFAIGLPDGVNFCYDPVRGGVSYAWTGDFIDISSARPGVGGKFITPVKLMGPLFYREDGPVPLRRGDPARVPAYEFKGYTLHDDGIEFRYTLDGVLVRESIRSRAGQLGLVRRFVIEGGADARWWYVVEGKPATELAPAANGARVLEVNPQTIAP